MIFGPWQTPCLHLFKPLAVQRAIRRALFCVSSKTVGGESHKSCPRRDTTRLAGEFLGRIGAAPYTDLNAGASRQT